MSCKNCAPETASKAASETASKAAAAMRPLRILHLGLGPMGHRTVALARERGFQVVAAADPKVAGQDLGTLCGIEPQGVTVRAGIAEALADLQGRKPDIAVVTTVSSLRLLESQVAELAAAGLSVVSTCEELVYPWLTQPERAARIDALCRDRGVACLGTGVNPGFLMDYLPVVLTSVCRSVQSIRVERVQDASVRRVPFQVKIGSALTLEQFAMKKADGTLRHVGLPESLDLIAHRLGWTLSGKTESLEPIVAAGDVAGGWAPIRKGMARGVEQVAHGFRDGKEVLTLYFRAAVGEPKSYDRVEIRGDPPMRMTFEGGVNGDTATSAITLNAIRPLLAAPAGLRTMVDIAAPAYREEPA